MGTAITKSGSQLGPAAPRGERVADVPNPLTAETVLERRFLAIYDRVYKRALPKLTYLSNIDVASDIVHDVMSDFWKRLAEGKLTLDQLSEAAVYTALKNSLIDYRTRQKLRVELTPELETTGVVPHIQPLASTDPEEINRVVGDLFEQLSAQQRRVWLLHRVDHFTFEQIGGILGISTDTARTHFKRATQYMKDKLRKAGFIARVTGSQSRGFVLLSAPKEVSND